MGLPEQVPYIGLNNFLKAILEIVFFKSLFSSLSIGVL